VALPREKIRYQHECLLTLIVNRLDVHNFPTVLHTWRIKSPFSHGRVESATKTLQPSRLLYYQHCLLLSCRFLSRSSKEPQR